MARDSRVDPSGPGKRAAFAIAALLLGLFLAVILTELGLRAFMLARDYARCRQIAQLSPNSVLGYEMKPGMRCGKIVINNLGFRGPDIEREKRPGVSRLVILGDSIAFGVEVNQEETFSGLLQQRLNQEGLAGRRWEVINAAVGGYDLYQYREQYLYRCRSLCPDLVVVGICQNDLKPTGPYSLDFWGMVRGDVLDADPVPGPPILEKLEVYEKLAKWVQDRRLNAGGDRDALAKAKAPRLSEDWPQGQELLDKFLAELRADGVGAIFMVFPYKFQVTGLEQSSDEMLAAYMRQAGAPFLDLLPTFRNKRTDLYLPGDYMHLNVEGHSLTADTLIHYLRQHPRIVPASTNLSPCQPGASSS